MTTIDPADLAYILVMGAEGREEYIQNSSRTDHEYLKGQAAGMRSAAMMLLDRSPLAFLADEMPSWRWPPEVHQWVFRDPWPMDEQAAIAAIIERQKAVPR